MPPQMRGQFKKQQETAAMQRQMVDAQKPGSDGMPVFNLFVRTKRQNVSLLNRTESSMSLVCVGESIAHPMHIIGLVPMRVVQGR